MERRWDRSGARVEMELVSAIDVINSPIANCYRASTRITRGTSMERAFRVTTSPKWCRGFDAVEVTRTRGDRGRETH